MVEEFGLKIETADSPNRRNISNDTVLHQRRQQSWIISGDGWGAYFLPYVADVIYVYIGLDDRLQLIKMLESFPGGVERMNETSCTCFYCLEYQSLCFMTRYVPAKENGRRGSFVLIR
jgi:hypothetical protein